MPLGYVSDILLQRTSGTGSDSSFPKHSGAYEYYPIIFQEEANT